MPTQKIFSYSLSNSLPFLLAVFVLTFFSLTRPQHSYARQLKAADQIQDKAPIDLQQIKFSRLFTELKDKHNFKQNELQQIFQGLVIKKRVLELMDSQWEAKPYYKYRTLFITRKTIRTGKKKLHQYKKLLDKIEKQFGVDREVLVAIWGIETRFGTNFGGFNVLQTLTTLFDAYPRRSAFFRQQLIDFLILCRDNQVDPHTVEGSYAGAFGQTQFIPSSFLAYAVSFDGDSKRDVWNSVPDVLASIANYLKQFHWTLHAPVYIELGATLNDQRLKTALQQGRKGRVSCRAVARALGKDIPPSPDNRPLSIIALERKPVKNKSHFRYVAGYPNFQAITEWNHSNRYGMAVTELAESFKKP